VLTKTSKDLINKYSLTLSPAYATSKAALNLLIGKYNAAYGAQGILFLSIAPGMVDTAEGVPRMFPLCSPLSLLPFENKI
jgi:NAD(P)-dependent dehydrogenase (short-subunit alcohol dehydrogenase family)